MNNASDHVTPAQPSNVRHEAWCTVEAHEMDLAEYGQRGCYGRPLGDPNKMGGWLTQDAFDEAPRIVLDTRPLGPRHKPLTLQEAAELMSVLAQALAEATDR